MQLGILCRHPFTADIAKETVPEQFWGTANFCRTNYFLSWLWSVLFLIMTLSYVVSSFGRRISVRGISDT